MSKHETSHLQQADESWAKGQALEAGKLIFENLPPESRPRWASGILRVVLNKSGLRSSLFDQVLAAADCQGKWKTGHCVFDNLRRFDVEIGRQKKRAWPF